MKVLAPGKIILSGEHAVVYGQPALAMAVNRYVTATAVPSHLSDVSFDFFDLSYKGSMTELALKHLKKRIKEKYQRFLAGDFKIRDVLSKPVELAQFAFSLFIEMLNIKLTHGVKICIQSDIPMGCGMGSSAATILGITQAIAHHLQIELPDEVLLNLGLEAENMQHGFSSGLDLRVSLQGGCLFMRENQMDYRRIPELPMYLVNTGVPASSTGECVAAVAPHFKSYGLGNAFAEATMAMDAALQQESIPQFREAIQHNHTLLTQIGVVPDRVQSFIKAIQEKGGAAKICGAGAVIGQQAGVVLTVIDDLEVLQALCTEYAYSLVPISVELRGVHVV